MAVYPRLICLDALVQLQLALCQCVLFILNGCGLCLSTAMAGVTDLPGRKGTCIVFILFPVLQDPEGKYEALTKYARDLTAAAREGKLDPVIGRDDEIRRCIQILSRRTKNNPVLIGEPGVGKTAVAEGLAQRINTGDVPAALQVCLPASRALCACRSFGAFCQLETVFPYEAKQEATWGAEDVFFSSCQSRMLAPSRGHLLAFSCIYLELLYVYSLPFPSAGSVADGPGHGGADCGCQVPRRV